MGKERRRAERLKSNLFVNFEDSSPRRAKARGVVVDVSPYGFALETEAELNLNDIYFCNIEIPFALRAKVVRRSTMGQMKQYGMMLVKNSMLDMWVLKKLVKGIRRTRKIQE